MDNFRDLDQGEDLELIAYQKSDPFCYSCYRTVKQAQHITPRCIQCGSDDLMRKIDGVGCEWGIEWVVGHLIQDNLTPVDMDQNFYDYLVEIYPGPVTVCGVEIGQGQTDIWKDYDPIAYNCALSAWIDGEQKEGVIFTPNNGGDQYLTTDLIAWVDETVEVEVE